METFAAGIKISKTKDPRMKVGDLVKHVGQIDDVIPSGRILFPSCLGLVVDWYDSANGYVEVMWRYFGNTQFVPCHISKLEIISEAKN